jgi:hypothetical protein
MMTRQWLYAVLALAGGMFGGFAGGRLVSTAATAGAQLTQQSIEAQDIILLDAQHRMRGFVGVNKDGNAALSLFDHHGTLRTALEISDTEGVGFKLFDSSGALRISLLINGYQIPAVRLFDAQHRPRALLGVDPDGEGALDFYPEEGRILRELP